MSAPRHSAGTGFGSSAGGAAVRGGIVIGIALLVGFLLLQQSVGDDDLLPPSEAAPPGGPAAGTDTSTTTTVPTTDPSNAGSIPTTTTLPAARPPNEVKVVVANAAGINGAAGRATEELRALGYTTLEATDATEAADTSTLLFAEGFEPEARELASTLGSEEAKIAPLSEPVPIAVPRPEANIVWLLGRDLAQAP